MKSFIVLSAVATSFCILCSVPAMAGPTRQVPLGVSSVYIPAGFDSTSSVFVVESGYFPNTCYKWDHASVVSPTAFLHEVRSTASVTPGLCGMIMIPFNQEVSIGKIGAGSHKIHFINGDGTYLEKVIEIEQ